MSKENLGIITLEGSKNLANKVDSLLQEWRRPERSFIIPSECPRFGTGESKGVLKESVRGKDIYILVDICNYSITKSFQLFEWKDFIQWKKLLL